MATAAEDAAVDAYCIEWCKSKVKVLGVDVDAAWKPKVRATPPPPLDRSSVLVVDARATTRPSPPARTPPPDHFPPRSSRRNTPPR